MSFQSRYYRGGGTPSEYVDFIEFTCTASSGTFTEAVINLPAPKYSNYVPVLHAVEYEYPQLVGTDNKYVACQICSESQSGIIYYNNTNLIDKLIRFNDLTTSGQFQEDRTPKHEFKPPLLLPFEKIYCGLAGDATLTIYGRLHISWRPVSERRIMQTLVRR